MNNKFTPFFSLRKETGMTTRHTGNPIPGAVGYAADIFGHIYSTKSNWRGYGVREMVQDLNSDGYPSVRIYMNGTRKRMTVHSLIARTFLEIRPSRAHEIRHIDGNKMNIKSSNLSWGTRQDNANDRENHGRTSRGNAHSHAIKSSAKWAQYWKAYRNV